MMADTVILLLQDVSEPIHMSMGLSTRLTADTVLFDYLGIAVCK